MHKPHIKGERVQARTEGEREVLFVDTTKRKHTSSMSEGGDESAAAKVRRNFLRSALEEPFLRLTSGRTTHGPPHLLTRHTYVV